MNEAKRDQLERVRQAIFRAEQKLHALRETERELAAWLGEYHARDDLDEIQAEARDATRTGRALSPSIVLDLVRRLQHADDRADQARREIDDALAAGDLAAARRALDAWAGDPSA